MEYISIASGSSGNCHYIKDKTTSLIIDAGLSGKKIIQGITSHDIEIEKTKAILITHEHTDHIKGAGIISRKYDLPIYITQGTYDEAKDKLGKLKEENIKIIKPRESFQIDNLQITPIPISHDAKEPVAYAIENEKEKISIITDLGEFTQEQFQIIKGSKMVALESNHDLNMLMAGPYTYSLKQRVKSKFGHLSNEDAGKIAARLYQTGTKTIYLSHLSRQNNIPILAYQTVINILGENNIPIEEINLGILEPFQISQKMKI